MRISERAFHFAINSYKKNNTDTNLFRSIIVGDILKCYDFDEKVVAAGYLHEVTKNTEYSINDIAQLFGGEVSSLIMTTNFPDIDDWQQKIKISIKNCQNLPINNKSIIIADLIAQLEESRINSKDVNYENQKHYYQEMLKTLEVDSEETVLVELLDRLYLNILVVFYNYKIDTFGKNNSFIKNKNNYLVQLKSIIKSSKPSIIQFSKQNTGSSVKKIGLNLFDKNIHIIKVLEKKTTDKYERDYIEDNRGLSVEERNLLIASEIELGLLSESLDNRDIIILNQDLFNRLLLIRRFITSDTMKEKLNKYIEFYLPQINNIINYQLFPYTSSKNATNHYSNLEVIKSNHRVLKNLIPIMKSDYILKLKLMLEKKN